MGKSIRNLVIFSIVAVGCGFVGIAVNRLTPTEDPMQGLGALVWLVSPLAANLLLRWLGGDGWKDFGIKPNFKGGWFWYLAALLIAPLVTIVVLGVGVLFGAISFTGFKQMGVNVFLPLVGAAFVGAMVKNIFEEFAWRGYLTPRFEAIQLHPFLNSLLTGLVWAGWHVPYYLYFLDRTQLEAHTSLSVPAFILLAFLVLPLQALAYGELRLLSGTVWTVWLLHTIANAFSLSLLSNGFVQLQSGLLRELLSPGTAGILYSLIMGLIGLWLYRFRRSKALKN